MPLTVYNEDDHPAQARSVYDRSITINRYRRGEAFPNGFYVANSTQPTALATSSAATCLIMIVHKRPGVGALGHYFATPYTKDILIGFDLMVQKLGGGPIDSVVYAAGSSVGANLKAQKVYELMIYGGTLHRHPGANVRWPVQDGNNNWGSAVYLPLTAEVALFHSLPENGFSGSADGTEGVTAVNYPFSN